MSEKPRSSRAKELLLALGSASVALLGLLGAERWARHRDASAQPSHTVLHRYSERFGWEPRPRVRLCEGTRCITVNERGYRGRLLADGGRRGEELRVVVVGDSVAFGYDVDDHETFSAHLDRRDGLAVANLAVQGYGTDQSLLRLRALGPELSPDVLVLSVCIANDPVDNRLDHFLYDGRYPKPFFTLAGSELRLRDEHLALSARGRLARALQERSALYRLLVAPPGTPRSEGTRHWLDIVEASLADLNAAVDLTARLLAETARLGDSWGARTLILLHPADKTFTRGRRIVRKLLRSPHLEGRSVLDLQRRYEAMGVSRDELLLDELGHLDPWGHALTAEIAAQALAETPGSGEPDHGG